MLALGVEPATMLKVQLPGDCYAEEAMRRCSHQLSQLSPAFQSSLPSHAPKLIFQMSTSGCPCPGYQRTRRFSQLSSTQILNQQDPGAMKNGCCFKPLSIIGRIGYETTDNQNEKHIYAQIEHVCVSYVYVRKSFP